MPVTQPQLDRILQLARARESMGYFARVKAGDQKAASLFARLIAYDDNPEGSSAKSGWLSKVPGESQVDGWAEDAICGNADSGDLHNVIDLVNGAGAPGASLPGRLIIEDLKPRREANHWAAPKALTSDELAYLQGGAVVVPPPVVVIPPFPPRDEVVAFGVTVNVHYGRKGAGGNGTLGAPEAVAGDTRYLNLEGECVWLPEYLRLRQLGESHEDATKHVLAAVDAAWPK
jgi:hypothetical protein